MIVCDKLEEINTFSKEERKEMVATFLTVTNKNFSCYTCGKRYETEAKKRFRKNKGCYSEVDFPVATINLPSEDRDYSFNRCPANFASNYFSYLINLFYEQKSGKNIYKEAISDLPYKLIQAFSLIESLFTGQEIKRRKQVEALNRGKR